MKAKCYAALHRNSSVATSSILDRDSSPMNNEPNSNAKDEKDEEKTNLYQFGHYMINKFLWLSNRLRVSNIISPHPGLAVFFCVFFFRIRSTTTANSIVFFLNQFK